MFNFKLKIQNLIRPTNVNFKWFSIIWSSILSSISLISVEITTSRLVSGTWKLIIKSKRLKNRSKIFSKVIQSKRLLEDRCQERVLTRSFCIEIQSKRTKFLRKKIPRKTTKYLNYQDFLLFQFSLKMAI